jgi:hypothetical protein
MTKDRKTVYVNDQPVQIFLWAEVQHCVNAYNSDLYLSVHRGEAEIVDEIGGASAGVVLLVMVSISMCGYLPRMKMFNTMS